MPATRDRSMSGRQGYGPKRAVVSGDDLRSMAQELASIAAQVMDWAEALDDLGVTMEISRGSFDNAASRLRYWVIQQVERNLKISAEKAGKRLRKSEGR